MTSVIDIRPTVAPVSLATALSGLEIHGFFAPDGSPASIADSALRLRGITVSSDDCEPDWLFPASSNTASVSLTRRSRPGQA